METTGFEELAGQLDAALEWCGGLGLARDAVPGRFGDYRQRVRRLIEIVAAETDGRGTDEHRRELRDQEPEYVMALSESMQFADIVPYLKSCGADLRASKVRDALSGPASPGDETASANQARNTLFEIVVASKFWRAGARPGLGQVADVEVSFNDQPYVIECKRPFSATRVERLIQEAGAQLSKRVKERKESVRGLIALSLSKLRETPGPDEVDDVPDVAPLLLNDLRSEAERIKQVWGAMNEDVVAGVMLHIIKPLKLRVSKLYVVAQQLVVVARQGSKYADDLRRMTSALQEGNKR